MRTLILIGAVCATLAACGPQRPAIDPALDSGVTSSNGGGMRATGAVPNIGVGSNGATVTSGAPAGRGNGL